MRYTISGKNIEITNALREVATNKLSKLEKYFSEDTEVQVTLSVLKKNHIIEVTLP
ncbi:MAG: ribosomal subunit interface protein, partial [Firmicutes bacterium HGW-Firmicutes-5]